MSSRRASGETRDLRESQRSSMMTDGMLSQTEGEASGAGMRCGWRQWAAMWATVLVGMALSLLLTGRSALVLTP